MKIVSQFHFRNMRVRTMWMLEWRLGGKGVPQRICFFTEAEATAALASIMECCRTRAIDPCALPRTAIEIMLRALSEGREAISFIPGDQIAKRSVH
jgi:hypothetical protein